jgi:2-polyprenyl-6-methoxyphenol hydroxylase-like FAD-dependent oxidoreductase
MPEQPYDAIVVGARCAGAPTAMLLARRGYRVLLVDKAAFPSETISTHLVHPPGVAALARWGVLEGALAGGCPPIGTYRFDFGAFALSGSPGEPAAYCPRRSVLDEALVRAAAEAGAEVREEFIVDQVLVDRACVIGIRGRARGGRAVTERARIVVGADGMGSLVARTVRAESYHERPPLLAAYYAYWSGLPMAGCFETFVRPGRGFAAAPTNDGLTVVIAGWPYAEFEVNKKDVEGHYARTLALAPAFAERLGPARREGRLVGMAVPNFFRKPFGPGWALVGDAGYNKDFITGQGIQDAFRDAELCAEALDETLSGARTFAGAMSAYRARRDAAALPMYEFTCQLATLEPPPPALARLLSAIEGDAEAMGEFVRVNAGVTSPAEFLSEANVGRLLTRAGAAAAR